MSPLFKACVLNARNEQESADDNDDDQLQIEATFLFYLHYSRLIAMAFQSLWQPAVV